MSDPKQGGKFVYLLSEAPFSRPTSITHLNLLPSIYLFFLAASIPQSPLKPP